MATTAVQSNMNTFIVDIPKVDIKRFKGILKAMGWSLHKEEYYESPAFYADIDRSEQEIAEGKCVVLKSVEEINNLFK